jgi:two-component system response regulator YesN
MKTVLVVDDETLIRWSLTEGLKGDFNVVAAGTAEEALEVLKKVPVHAVITDLRMPGMGGMELAERILSERPGLCLIVQTAYAFDPLVKHLRSLGVREVLPKPFDLAALRSCLHSQIPAA